MVTLIDRRDYYDAQNGTKTILATVDGVLVVPEFNHLREPQQATTEILEALPEADIEAWLTEEIFNEKVRSMTTAVQIHLDETAQSWGYDNIISLCTYEGNSHPKYSAEGWAGKSWRSSVWSYCEIELAKIKAGTRPDPESAEAFVLGLPTITRPVA